MAVSSGTTTRLRVWLLLAPALLLVAGLFVAPLGLGVLESLGFQPYLESWSWTGAHYATLVHDPAVRASLLLTARITVLATGVSVVLALAVAQLVRASRWGRRVLTVLTQAVLPVPHLAGVLAMTLLLAQSGMLSRLAHAVGLAADPQDFPALTQDGFGWAILAEYVWKETPFLTLAVLGALAREVPEFEDVARTLGAGAWHRFSRVTLPLVAPSLAAAAVIVAAFTLGSYEVPALLGRPYPATLPVVAYQRYTDTDLLVRPQAYAIATVLTVVTGLLAWTSLRMTERLTGVRR